MERAADWQLANPSKHEATDWTQGAGDTGMMALAGISGNAKYRESMRATGDAARWQPGRRMYNADDHCVGQTYAELYLLSRENAMIAPLRARFDAILSAPSRLQSLDFKPSSGDPLENWSWCDSLFMAPPAWVRLAAATGNGAYTRFAVDQWWETTQFLYDRQEHLYYRDSTFFNKREANGTKVFWSRGNGWVIAGIARTLEFLPPDTPARARFESLYRELAARLVGLQQPDGFWRTSLLDPASFPMIESSGTGLICFGLAWGMNHGILDRAATEPAILRAWAAIAGCVEADGKVNHVQPVGSSPDKFPAESTVPYGVGAFLLAGSEVARIRP